MVQIAAQFGEEGEQFLAGFSRKVVNAIGAGVKALCGDAVGKDDLVLLKHDVDVGHAFLVQACNVFSVDHMNGWHQNLGLTKHELGAVSFDEHAVLWRDDQIVRCAWKDGLGKVDGRKAILGADCCFPGPADVLHSVVLGDDRVADAQILNLAQARVGRDHGAEDKADDVLDIGKIYNSTVQQLNRSRNTTAHINGICDVDRGAVRNAL